MGWRLMPQLPMTVGPLCPRSTARKQAAVGASIPVPASQLCQQRRTACAACAACVACVACAIASNVH